MTTEFLDPISFLHSSVTFCLFSPLMYEFSLSLLGSCLPLSVKPVLCLSAKPVGSAPEQLRRTRGEVSLPLHPLCGHVELTGAGNPCVVPHPALHSSASFLPQHPCLSRFQAFETTSALPQTTTLSPSLLYPFEKWNRKSNSFFILSWKNKLLNFALRTFPDKRKKPSSHQQMV